MTTVLLFFQHLKAYWTTVRTLTRLRKNSDTERVYRWFCRILSGDTKYYHELFGLFYDPQKQEFTDTDLGEALNGMQYHDLRRLLGLVNFLSGLRCTLDDDIPLWLCRRYVYYHPNYPITRYSIVSDDMHPGGDCVLIRGYDMLMEILSGIMDPENWPKDRPFDEERAFGRFFEREVNHKGKEDDR